ncbi:heme exporter protein CcmD [Xanthomonas sp. A2111]|uniref:Heme exporter protein D n=1 Tax=Xanthomonas hawaiiensis TaxID=3003247 RepID=A0ABU2HZ61_9XANT|nr:MULTISPECIES: heme exporter protein CcmD [unclassified Xanthomonas]MBO9830292.1 heme exporter protein CcmD [Xanthomonas sp. A2111]MBO9872078.1 heme exporter protein CcmD [Xanthomonas sp. D-93]MDS9991185.1 heme exporter protein CcmD [Xanthomonas sp. A2111]WNH43025.1 heme exporter protein CcmD [Xanthomonas sp. A6251]
MSGFWAMGGYAVYVWSAYALALVVLILDCVLPRRRQRRLLAEIRAQVAREQARRARGTAAAVGVRDASHP